MAVSKVIYKSSPQATGETWIDATTATAAAADILAPKTAMLADGVMTTGTGSKVYYTQYTLTGDTTIATFIPAIAYEVHSTSCIIILRSNGTVAPSTGSYTLNNILTLFQSGVRKSAAEYYSSGKVAPNFTTTDVLFTKETNTLIDMTNGVLTTSSVGASCIGAAGDVVTLAEIDVDDDFYDILRAIQTV